MFRKELWQIPATSVFGRKYDYFYWTKRTISQLCTNNKKFPMLEKCFICIVGNFVFDRWISRWHLSKKRKVSWRIRPGIWFIGCEKLFSMTLRRIAFYLGWGKLFFHQTSARKFDKNWTRFSALCISAFWKGKM